MLVLGWLVLLVLVVFLWSGKFERARVGPGAGDGRDVIEFWAGVTPGQWYEDVLREVVEEYNRQQDEVYINALMIPFSIYQGKIKLAVATGQPPDVFENATSISESVRQKMDIPDLTVPIPEDLLPPETQKRYGPACMSAISKEGTPRMFPRFTYLMGGELLANAEWFEKAGLDLRAIIAEGWDYAEFREGLKKVQAAMRAELGEQAYAMGINLAIIYGIYYQDLLPAVVGLEKARRGFLKYEGEAGRYVLDPEIRPEELAQPLQLMYELINVDETWGKPYLGLPYSDLISQDFLDKRLVALTHADTPGVPVALQIDHMRKYERGQVERPIRLSVLPAPTPRKGMPRVSVSSAFGWGVMRQVDYKGDEHTRHALEFARYMGSPEVLAEFYKAQGIRRDPWPDNQAVLALAPDVNDPIKADPGLGYLWEVYLDWMQSPHVYSANQPWPQQNVRKKVDAEISYQYIGSYQRSGEGHQLVERVLYGEIEPLEAARKMLEDMARIIDEYYRLHPEDIARPGPASTISQ